MSGRRGMTLLEVLVAVAILAIGVAALGRLLAGSAGVVVTDGAETRAMMLARTLLAEAELRPPEPGHETGVRPGGLAFERDVRRTPHPALREVRVRVSAGAGVTCDLVELVRVPPA